MKMVSPLLKRVLYPPMAWAGAFAQMSASGLAILTYHGVVPAGYEPVDASLDGNLISAEMLRCQLRLLKARYGVISPEQALAWRQGKFQLPKRAVLLTCDDGLLNCLTDMLPVLQEEGVRCLFFVTGASTADARSGLWYEDLFLMLLRAPDGPFEFSQAGIEIRAELKSRQQRRAVWWSMVKQLSQADRARRGAFLNAWQPERALPDRELGEKDSVDCRRFGLLTRHEINELSAAGMTIGAHTVSHPMLSQLSADLAYREICESRAQLESVLPTPVWAFAYPFGNPESVTSDILGMPRSAGFDAAFLNCGGGLGANLPPYALPRIHVTAQMSLSEFEAHVSGFHTRLQRMAGRENALRGVVPSSE